MYMVRISIDEYLSDDPQPGIVKCSLVDAVGRKWYFIEKTAIVSSANLTAASIYPQVGQIACTVLSIPKGQGKQIARIDTNDPWAVESLEGETKFDVFTDELTENEIVA